MSRPGFVLTVDERTPPLLMHSGESFRLQEFPLGTRVVYPPESLPGLVDVDEAIVSYVENEYALLLGERSSEDIKIEVGSAFPLREERTMRVRGRDLVSGLPKTVTVTSQEVRRAIDGPLLQICELVRGTLDVCPPELAGDVLDTGIVLTGGGAMLRGLDARMRHELGVPVRAADSPLRSVATGSGRCVEEFTTLHRVLIDSKRY